MKVRLTKLKDLAFEGEHPRGINEGSVREGLMVKLPIVGEPVWLFSGFHPIFHTSTVVHVYADQTFKTFNSLYKYEILDKIPDNKIYINGNTTDV